MVLGELIGMFPPSRRSTIGNPKDGLPHMAWDALALLSAMEGSRATLWLQRMLRLTSHLFDVYSGVNYVSGTAKRPARLDEDGHNS